MPLPCPLDGDALEMVILDAMLPIEAVAWQCATCGGALLDITAQKSVIGQGIAVATDNPGVRPSPRTGKPMYRMDAAGIELDGCADTGSVWFDRGELLLLRQIVQRVRSEKGKDDPFDAASPVHELQPGCADCGDALDESHAPTDTAIGIVCTTCPRRLGFDGASGEGLATREVTAGDRTVAISHRGSRTEIRVALDGDGALDAVLAPRTLWTRVRGLLGGSTTQGLTDELSAHFTVERADPAGIAAFLRKRGVHRLLVRLARTGSARVEASADHFAVIVDKHAGDDAARLEVEQSTRRLLSAALQR